ncbi:MAG: HAMP domain-containing sensor histidine kinase [Bacteroidota bacterium]
MKKLTTLFIIVTCTLLVLLLWWWSDRYTREASYLEESLGHLVKDWRTQQVFVQVFESEALPFSEDHIQDSTTIVTFTYESLDNPSHSSDKESTESWSGSTKFGKLEDRWVRQKMNDNGRYFFTEDSIEAVLEAFSQEHRVRTKIVPKAGDELLPADTAGLWYITMLNVPKFAAGPKISLESKEDQYVILSHYNFYLFSKIWPELLLGIFLLIGLIGLYLVVRRDLLRQQRQLEQKDRFIANIAHELKTPIATVSVALEALDDFGADRDRKKRQEYLQIGRQELNRLDLLANRALKSLQLDKEDFILNREPIDLKSLVEKAFDGIKLQHRITEENSALVVEGKKGESTDSVVQGDPELMRHLAYNLLDNAAKYGGEPKKIAVQLSKDGNMQQLVIADNGLGVPDADRERIFEKFYRVDRQDGHRIKGHGLGLSYVQQIARAHGGEVEVSRDPTLGGARFTVKIPVSGQ